MEHISIRQSQLIDKLYVIAVISNPRRYKSRYNLYYPFEHHMKESGAELYTVEASFGDRPHVITDPNNPNHIQVQTDHEFWIKENMVNIGISRLPADWKYVAWIDADVHFANPLWVPETIHALQHYDIVQLFSEAQDLGPDGIPFNRYRSFSWSHVHGIPRINESVKRPSDKNYNVDKSTPLKDGIAYWHHSGYAWAAKRETIDHLGGLIDWAVVGEADYIMSRALVGEATKAIYPGVSPNYLRPCLEWEYRALQHIRKNIGFVPGLLLHYFHGKKAERKYWDRCKILVETQFDPAIHLKKDWQGLYQLVDRMDDNSIKLRDAIRTYLSTRNEDSIDL